MSRTMHRVVPAYARRRARRVYIFVCWFGGILVHVIPLMTEGRCCMVVVVSGSSRQSREIESSIRLDVDPSHVLVGNPTLKKKWVKELQN